MPRDISWFGAHRTPAFWILEMAQEKKLVANPHVVFREEFDDWVILFEPDRGVALGLNPIGAFIWKLCDGTRSQIDILHAIVQQFESVPEEAPDHLQGFVEELVSRGFVGYIMEEA